MHRGVEVVKEEVVAGWRSAKVVGLDRAAGEVKRRARAMRANAADDIGEV